MYKALTVLVWCAVKIVRNVFFFDEASFRKEAAEKTAMNLRVSFELDAAPVIEDSLLGILFDLRF